MDRRKLLLGCGGLALARAATAQGTTAEEPRVERDLVYREVEGVRLLMDVYHGRKPGRRPAVLLVHGGGWLGGSKQGYREIGPWLADQGYTACAINYRLAPQHPYPAAMDDCHHAVRWLRVNAQRLGLHPRRIAAMGDSAGGHLVALIGVRDAREKGEAPYNRFSGRPDAVIANYGAHELVRMWKIEQAHRPLTAWLGGSPETHAENYRVASPVSMVDGKAPPFLVIHGDRDTVNPLEQSELLHQALRRKGRESTLLVIPGAGHGWPLASEYGTRWKESVLEFLGKKLR